MAGTNKYRVRDGFTFGKSKQYRGGDIVEMTPEEAKGFLDKLEPVEKVINRGGEKVAVTKPADTDSELKAEK